jgi:hypothetical protein
MAMTSSAVPPTDEDALEADIRRIVSLADPTPEAWRTDAEASAAWLRLEGRPVELAYDLVSGRDQPVGGVQVAGLVWRELRYELGGRGIELELEVGEDRVRVLGRLRPGRPAEVVAVWPEGRRSAVADDGGQFHFDELPYRPLCFVVVGGDEPAKTGWIMPGQ